MTGPRGGNTQGQGPWAHSRDNKAWLCAFYSFQYLPDPEGSLGHKVPRGEKTEGTKLMRASHVGTSKHNKLQTEDRVKEAPLKRVGQLAFKNKDKYKDLNGRMKPKKILR